MAASGYMIRLFFFSSALFMEIVYVGLFGATIKRPLFRFWPPPSALSWQFFAAWVMAGLVSVEFGFLGLLDYDSFVLPGLRARLPIAVVFFVVGVIIGTWAFIEFPFRATIGLGDRLITSGPYRYSRNPQYIGDSLLIVGYFIFSNSWMAGVVGLLGVMLNLLAPFTEEPWLEAHFGSRYLDYKGQVARFIGRPKSKVE
jgi:protein-S-isoprenylcysteine O-methyltransferase Ste14